MTFNRFRPIMPANAGIIPGATYFITSVTHERQRWFDNPVFAQIIVD